MYSSEVVFSSATPSLPEMSTEAGSRHHANVRFGGTILVQTAHIVTTPSSAVIYFIVRTERRGHLERPVCIYAQWQTFPGAVSSFLHGTFFYSTFADASVFMNNVLVE